MKRPLRITLIAVLTLLVFAGAFFGALKYWLFRNACDRLNTVLARGPEGRTVVSKLEACTAIGTSVTVYINLVSHSGKAETVFSYEPAYGMLGVPGPLQPSASWTSPHTLKISIGTVADIIKQRTDVDDLYVTYEITKNLHMEREISN